MTAPLDEVGARWRTRALRAEGLLATPEDRAWVGVSSARQDKTPTGNAQAVAAAAAATEPNTHKERTMSPEEIESRRIALNSAVSLGVSSGETADGIVQAAEKFAAFLLDEKPSPTAWVIVPAPSSGTAA